MTKATGKSTTEKTGGGKEANPQSLFFTAGPATEGIKLPLRDPSNQKTAHWLHIIGVDSDTFRLADAAAKRRAVELGSIKDDTERDKAIMAMTRDLTAHLVVAWSFPQECTHANVVEFFKQAPHLQRTVDMAAINRSLFCKVESES